MVSGYNKRQRWQASSCNNCADPIITNTTPLFFQIRLNLGVGFADVVQEANKTCHFPRAELISKPLRQ